MGYVFYKVKTEINRSFFLYVFFLIIGPVQKDYCYIGCNKEFPISMSRLYHLTSWHGDKKSEQCHVKQNCNLYTLFTFKF
ncbi:hypothetical protein E5Z46_18515 [Geobacillus kaustophilus NBRC 102445]|nr:hypothetical protein E5Z46_18515 [Geobacillus kaustophilus NBRC 102445]